MYFSKFTQHLSNHEQLEIMKKDHNICGLCGVMTDTSEQDRSGQTRNDHTVISGEKALAVRGRALPVL